MEKWLYVIVGLTFLSGMLGTGHHYYLDRRAAVLAVDRRRLLGARAARRSWPWPPTPTGHAPLGPGASQHARAALDDRRGVFSTLGAGILGLAHTWPQVNKWTHGTHITAMHGHMAFFGAYAMIVLGIITYALPALTGHADEERADQGRDSGRSGCRSAACSA